MQIIYKNANSIVSRVMKNEQIFSKLTDEQLRRKIDEIKQIIDMVPNKEVVLDAKIEDVFSCVREAAYRTLGLKAYKVQLDGACRLHQGNIIEMKTGEGKTLTCTFPAILNAITKKVHIITVNDYLAKRDSQDMGRLYNFLGFSCGCITTSMTEDEKRKAYKNDIVYITNTEIGFDYLRDNQKKKIEDKILPRLEYAIIDEADSILIDEARTPLIISGERAIDSSIYSIVDAFIKSLKRGKDKDILIEGDELFNKQSKGELTKEEQELLGDFTVDEINKKVILTERGINKVESFFAVKLHEDSNFIHFVENSLKANYLFKKDKEYIVRDNQIFLIDANTGRLMDGRQYTNGLHQAIQAKEKVEITRENITLATITLQSFFRMYDKLSGMTGTIESSKDEIKKIYNIDIKKIKTNLPIIRNDHSDIVFKSRKEKYEYLIELIKKHSPQPILIGCSSIDESEYVSKQLKDNEIEHTVLNAKNHEREAHIISQAGKLGVVTVATNMAGRGTDILLGGNPSEEALLKLKEEGYDKEALFNAQSVIVDKKYSEVREKYLKYKDEFSILAKNNKAEVVDAGGLFVIGTEKQESKRIDDQLRGRSGRQGDIGESVFLVSLEDENIKNLLVPSGKKKILESIEKGETSVFGLKMIRNAQKKLEAKNFEARKEVFEYDLINDKYRCEFYTYRDTIMRSSIAEIEKTIIDNIFDPYILKYVDEYLKEKEIRGYDPESHIKELLLDVLDTAYVDFLIALDQLRDFTSLLSFGSKKPIDMYRQVSQEYYGKLLATAYMMFYDYMMKHKKVSITIEL